MDTLENIQRHFTKKFIYFIYLFIYFVNANNIKQANRTQQYTLT